MALTKLNNNSLHSITDSSALKNATNSILQVKKVQRDLPTTTPQAPRFKRLAVIIAWLSRLSLQAAI